MLFLATGETGGQRSGFPFLSVARNKKALRNNQEYIQGPPPPFDVLKAGATPLAGHGNRLSITTTQLVINYNYKSCQLIHKKTLDNRQHTVVTSKNDNPTYYHQYPTGGHHMSKPRLYHHQGTLTDCITALVARSGSFPTLHLSIVSNDRSNYYGLVDDSYFAEDRTGPDDGHMRLVLRLTDSELSQLVACIDSLQGDLFDKPKPDPGQKIG
jgi:hypothetical protein